MHPARAALIGCGGMARSHIRRILEQPNSTEIVAICEPSEAAYLQAAALFSEAGIQPPPNEPDLARMLAQFAPDAAVIVSPHAYHCAQALACLEAGADVLLEKPMVMTADEARRLIAARDRTGRTVVVAFQGSLSPRIRTAERMLRSGELGRLLSISALVWQNWGSATAGTWRQEPALSGGGFLFDTGAHMLNTVADLAGQDFAEVAAWFDTNGRPVETLAVVIGRLANGALVTLHGCGEAIPGAGSEVRVFCEHGIVTAGIWGDYCQVQRAGEPEPEVLTLPKPVNVWETFLAVRAGEMPNPSPPEVGLRMARLWDAIRASAAQNGHPVRVE
jgi:predicted dehydrogenase